MKCGSGHTENGSGPSRRGSGRKLTARLLVLCMVIGMLPAAAFAVDAGQADWWIGSDTYTLAEDTEWAGEDCVIGGSDSGAAPLPEYDIHLGAFDLKMDSVTVAKNNILNIDGELNNSHLFVKDVQLLGAMVVLKDVLISHLSFHGAGDAAASLISYSLDSSGGYESGKVVLDGASIAGPVEVGQNGKGGILVVKNHAEINGAVTTSGNSRLEIIESNINEDMTLNRGTTCILGENTTVNARITAESGSTLIFDGGGITLNRQIIINDGATVDFKNTERMTFEKSSPIELMPGAVIRGEVPLTDGIVYDYYIYREMGDMFYYIGGITEDNEPLPVKGLYTGVTALDGRITFIIYAEEDYRIDVAVTPEGAYDISEDADGNILLTFPAEGKELQPGSITLTYTENRPGNPGHAPGASYSSSGAASASVRVVNTYHGSFNLSDQNARPGDTVTVTPKPDQGYRVGEVIVRDRDGSPIPVTCSDDGTFRFVMPEAKYLPVSVEMTFILDDTVGGFRDVHTGDYFAEAVKWAVENGITAGTGDGTFSPGEPCTRGQIMTFLWKASGSPEPAAADSPFTDVNADDYFYKAVLWAVENGITSGTSETAFSPGDPCTRGQSMTFLYKAAKSPAAGAAGAFTDVPADAYYAQAVAWAVNHGITAGTGETTFSPDQTCTRGQIVTFLYRDLVG